MERNKMNETPRTDEKIEQIRGDCKIFIHDEIYIAGDFARQLERELTTVTKQRDMLAEALSQCREDSVELLGDRDWWQYEIRLDYQKRYQETRDNVTRADEALQSLNQPEP